MKKSLIILSLVIFCLVNSFAQEKVKYFELDAKDVKAVGSSYGAIRFLDSREDTSSYGIVRIGTLNKEAAVLTQVPLEKQLSDLLAKSNGSATPSGELVFQLRRLKFVEKAEAENEYGYCFFRANIFTPYENGYSLVSAIDTFIVVESNDVTNLILDEANKAVVKFFTASLNKAPKPMDALSYNEILKIDSIEKLKIKVYNTDEYVNGVYKTFLSFKNQTPDYSLFSITFEDGEITGLKAKNRKGKVIKIKSDNVYAIVNNGKPFISAQFGYYPLVKNNNEFYFIGDDKINYIKGQVVKSNSIFSNTEYVFSPLPLTSVYEIKIDHVNGKFMRVKEIK